MKDGILYLCVFTVWLELILSEIPERNQTKEVSPPPQSGGNLVEFSLTIFLFACPLKKILKGTGKFLLGSALQVFGRCGGVTNARGQKISFPTPPPFFARSLKMRRRA
ncbi:MAG: hypothetical protein AAB340_00340, partial [Patescibacteria group bacterium]